MRTRSVSKLLTYSEEVLKKLYDAKTPEDFKQETIQHQHILRRFLHDTGIKGQQGKTQNNSETIQLICRVADNRGQNQRDYMVKLDYSNRTANDYSANITDAEVRWEAYSEDKNTKYNFVLNRYSGSIVISTARFPNLFSGKCYRSTERQF
jgi:hypothetical protein